MKRGDPALRRLAARAGLLPRWRDFRGQAHAVGDDTLRALLSALGLPCAGRAQIAESDRRLRAEPAEPEIARSARAFGIDDAAVNRRLWALSVQLYSLKRDHDGGIGHYTAVAELAQAAAGHGADALALSPAHAAFSGDASRYSPYAPSSRLFLNAWYIDPDAVPGGTATAGRTLRASELIDWPRAGRARMRQLRREFDHVSAALLDPGTRAPHAREFRDFRLNGGRALEDHARFEALFAWQRRDWHAWPAALRDPRSRAVADFARANANEVAFHVFLQWLAQRQLAHAQERARAAGMRVGLIADLAVGTDPAGSHAWSRREELLMDVAVGAPPDQLSVLGQDWGLTTYSPRALRERGFEPFLALLRAALAHCGGLRIDHVLGLNRLWLIPRGARPVEGAYLRYPLKELLCLAAQESRRRRAILIGEDLGTVPAGLRGQLDAAGLMGLRVLWFARAGQRYLAPMRWTREAVAATTTHDLPTVAGWWLARDLDWRARLRLFAPGRGERAERQARARERNALWRAFVRAGVAQGNPPRDAASVVDAAIRFVARTPSRLALVPIEDLAALPEQPNLPGTTTQHPNWRRRLPASAPELLARPDAAPRIAALNQRRD